MANEKIEDMGILDIPYAPKGRLVAAFVPMLNEELIGNAFIVSDTLVAEDIFTSVMAKKFRVEAEETRFGLEKITRDLSVSESKLSSLDERGIVKAGSRVKKNDLLVGKLTPEKGFMSPEERLLRVFFGEGERDLCDNSLVMPYQDEGIVIDTKYFSRKKDKNLPFGVNEVAEVYIAIKRGLKIGDVLRDKKGNKGVVAKISHIPIPRRYRPIDIVGGLSSDFISSLENCKTKSLWRIEGSSLFYLQEKGIKNSRQMAYLKEKRKLGYTEGKGEYESMLSKKAQKYEYLGEAKIGYLNLEKLNIPLEGKIAARLTGHYAIISKQPLYYGPSGYPESAKISEEELSAMKSLPNLAKEALTTRSDDTKRRVKAYEALVKNGRL